MGKWNIVERGRIKLLTFLLKASGNLRSSRISLLYSRVMLAGPRMNKGEERLLRLSLLHGETGATVTAEQAKSDFNCCCWTDFFRPTSFRRGNIMN